MRIERSRPAEISWQVFRRMVRSPTHDSAEEHISRVRKFAQCAPLPFEQFRSSPDFMKIVPYLSAEHNFMKNNLASFIRLYYTSPLG